MSESNKGQGGAKIKEEAKDCCCTPKKHFQKEYMVQQSNCKTNREHSNFVLSLQIT